MCIVDTTAIGILRGPTIIYLCVCVWGSCRDPATGHCSFLNLIKLYRFKARSTSWKLKLALAKGFRVAVVATTQVPLICVLRLVTQLTLSKPPWPPLELTRPGKLDVLQHPADGISLAVQIPIYIEEGPRIGHRSIIHLVCV